MIEASIPRYLSPSSVTLEPLDAVLSTELVISNDGFFPPVPLAAFVQRHKGQSAFAVEERLRVLRWAVQQVNAELAEQVCAWLRAGFYTLQAVPQLEFDQANPANTATPEPIQTLVNAYFEAVFAKASANLREEYSLTAITQMAEPRASLMLEASQTEHLRYRQAIYYLTGKAGQAACVELI